MGRLRSLTLRSIGTFRIHIEVNGFDAALRLRMAGPDVPGSITKLDVADF